MITLEQVKIIREKKKDDPDQMNLFGDNSGKKKKYNQPSKDQSDAIQSKSALNKSKKYASGEYPKIGGGERMSPKSKGPGASTGGSNIPPATVGGKNKGTTPVKVNITKPVKQSEVSKKAKEYTQKINKMRTAAKRSIKRQYPGDDSGAYKAMKADIDTKNLIKKAGGTGDIGFTAPDRKTKVAKRTTRAVKQGTPDPFSTPTPKKPIRPFGDKPVKTSAPGFGKGDTGGQMNVKDMRRSAFVKTQPKDVTLPKSFTDFSKKIKKYRVERDIERKIENPKLDISKVIKKRKSETPVQQSIPGTGGNRNIKKTYSKKTPRQKPPSGGGSSNYRQTSLFDPPPGGGKPSGSGSSGGGGGKPPKPPGGALVPSGGSSGGSGGSGGVDPDGVFKGPIRGKTDKKTRKLLKKQNKRLKKIQKMLKNAKGANVANATVNVGRKKRTAQDAINLAKKIKASRTPTVGKALKGAGKLAMKYPGRTGLIGLGVVAGGMALKSYLNRKDDLNINKDFAKTTTIKNPSGQNVRFKYSNKKDKDGNPTYKDQASSFLTKDQKNRIGGTIPGGLTKFRTGQYTANYKSGGKVGGRINIDKNMRSSAFEKQLKKAEKGTGFLGKQTQKDKDFLRKYKDATRPTAVK